MPVEGNLCTTQSALSLLGVLFLFSFLQAARRLIEPPRGLKNSLKVMS